MSPVRVLIVDDSATVCRLLTTVLSADPEIAVVGTAPEPAVAREMIKELNPDVVTLDIEMPHMNGLDFLDRIMRLRPMPVVMISTLTERGAAITIEALEMGAVDFFPKPTENIATILHDSASALAQKVKAAARTRPRSRSRARPAPKPNDGFVPGERTVAIGASTGGVEALIEVLSHFPANCPPTVVTQHMPAGFTKSFAARLDRLCAPHVSEAADGMPLAVGHVYVAPGSEAHLTIAGRGKAAHCRLVHCDPVSGHRPSVDMLFESVAQTAGHAAVGALLTGMGRDGARGLKTIRDAGGSTIGQDEMSAIIYGMPRVAFEMGAVAMQLPLEKIGPELLRQCKAKG